MKVFRFFPLLVIVVSFFVIVSYAFSQEQVERKIVVYKQSVSQDEKLKIISSNKAQVIKNLRLINGTAISISKSNVQKLSRDPRVLRVDPDAEVFAIPEGNVSIEAFNPKKCKRFPNLPECRPSPTLTPTPISTITPTLIPSPTPEPTSTPSPSLTPTPISTEGGAVV